MKTVAGILLVFSSLALSQSANDRTESLDLLVKLHSIHGFQNRAVVVSEALLGRTYALGTTGEGTSASFDADPIWRLDEFDCTTFIEAVLSLAWVKPYSVAPQDDFESIIRTIKYCDGEVCFPNRNHFTSLHWIPHMEDLGILKDLTTWVDPNAPLREKDLDIDQWYQARHHEIDQTFDSDWSKLMKSIEVDRDSENKRVSHQASLRYVPLESLLTPEVQQKIRQRGFLVFNLVKDEHSKVNIPVIVAHQGFLIVKDDGEIYLRHASSSKSARKTVDVPFVEYIQERQKDTTWPTLGLNLMALAGQD